MSRKWLNSTIAAAVVLTAAAGFAAQSSAVDAVFARSDSSTTTEPRALTRAAYPGDPIPGLDELISTLTVVDELPAVPGYERGCGTGENCVFGTAWTDKYDGPQARNGCDTRNDVLKIQLVDVAFKPGTKDCKVVAGTLHDPYTGTDITFSTSNPSAIQIDHVFPLARSWRAGASTWTPEERVNFANDTDLNLFASQGKANQSKSDQGPDTWLPANTAFHCEYVTNYITVAAKYHLTVTAGDINVARSACTQ